MPALERECVCVQIYNNRNVNDSQVWEKSADSNETSKNSEKKTKKKKIKENVIIALAAGVRFIPKYWPAVAAIFLATNI